MTKKAWPRATSDLKEKIKAFVMLAEKAFQNPIAAYSLSLLILTVH